MNYITNQKMKKKEAILTKDVIYLLLISKSKTNLFSSNFRQRIYFQII